MKKPKLNDKPAKTPAVKPAENFVGENCIHDICPDIWLATPQTIAAIAATLARNINDKPEVLADVAMKLFYASVERVISADWDHEVNFRREALYEKIGANGGDLFDAYVLDKKFPVTRDDFFNRIIRGSLKGRTADIAAMAKAYLRDTLRAAEKREPTLDEVAEAYQNWKPCETAREANALADRFHAWHRQHIKEARRVAGEKSVAKRKLKKKL